MMLLLRSRSGGSKELLSMRGTMTNQQGRNGNNPCFSDIFGEALVGFARCFAFMIAVLLVVFAILATHNAVPTSSTATKNSWNAALEPLIACGLLLPPVWFIIETKIFLKTNDKEQDEDKRDRKFDKFAHFQTITGQVWIAIAALFALLWEHRFFDKH
jgi:hypothetical protein